MKLSVAWIFDHIEADWRDVDIEKLVQHFNQAVAEIEGYEKVETNLAPFSLVEIKEIAATVITAFSPELNKEISLPIRDDAHKGNWYIVKEEDKRFIWASLESWCPSRQGLLPAIHVPETDRSGGWKKHTETKDYIIDVDNKSITHRPDMWSHRGVAREIAAMLDFTLKPLDSFVTKIPVKEYENNAPATADNPIAVEIKTDACNRFATVYFDDVSYTSCPWWIAHRLMRVGARPIDALVDITNYVLFDIGQPLHVFDADKIASKQIVVRSAKNKEKLLLLKNEEIELTSDDIVISDGQTPLSLAGIRGGLESGVSRHTKHFLLESAHFDAATIRKTSTRTKIRTEASARFEKSLDPYQNILGIERFVHLVKTQHIVEHVSPITSLGIKPQSITITVAHDFIESRLGVSIAPEFVMKIMHQLAFEVKQTDDGYVVTVPTFRATKDIAIPEDIVEEVGRLYGYNRIEPRLPFRKMAPFSIHEVQTRRVIKQQLAYGSAMHEVSNYAFFDEQFLQQLNWQPAHTISVANPVSENWSQLVTSLIPNLIKNVVTNKEHKELRFFDWARTWRLNGDVPSEHHTLSGIIFDTKKSINFYESKTVVEQLFDLLALPVSWHKVDVQEKQHHPWWLAECTAYLMYQGHKIGIAGMLDSTFYSSVISGDAFAFELDAQFLQSYRAPVKQYKVASKYPVVHRDMSMLVPLALTVDDITAKIMNIDARIGHVLLLDYFEKDEWKDHKSLTFSLEISDHSKTLTTQEIDAIMEQVIEQMKKLGATIR